MTVQRIQLFAETKTRLLVFHPCLCVSVRIQWASNSSLYYITNWNCESSGFSEIFWTAPYNSANCLVKNYKYSFIHLCWRIHSWVQLANDCVCFGVFIILSASFFANHSYNLFLRVSLLGVELALSINIQISTVLRASLCDIHFRRSADWGFEEIVEIATHVVGIWSICVCDDDIINIFSLSYSLSEASTYEAYAQLKSQLRGRSCGMSFHKIVVY